MAVSSAEIGKVETANSLQKENADFWESSVARSKRSVAWARVARQVWEGSSSPEKDVLGIEKSCEWVRGYRDKPVSLPP